MDGGGPPGWRRLRASIWALALIGLTARPALACPGCWLGRQVRASVFLAGFWTPLLAVVLPALLVTLVAGLLHHRGFRRSAPAPRSREHA
jgi:hypothetical protein